MRAPGDEQRHLPIASSTGLKTTSCAKSDLRALSIYDTLNIMPTGDHAK
jgi:hypothetical protein